VLLGKDGVEESCEEGVGALFGIVGEDVEDGGVVVLGASDTTPCIEGGALGEGGEDGVG